MAHPSLAAMPRLVAGYGLAILGVVAVIVSFFLTWEREYYPDQPLAAQTVFTQSPSHTLAQTQTNMQQTGSGPGALILWGVLIGGPPLLIALSGLVALLRKSARARTLSLGAALVGLLLTLLIMLNYRAGLDDSGRAHILSYGGFVALGGYLVALVGLFLIPRTTPTQQPTA